MSENEESIESGAPTASEESTLYDNEANIAGATDTGIHDADTLGAGTPDMGTPPLPDGQSVKANNGPKRHESTASVLAALVSNIAVGIFKFIAAGLSGSSALISEGIHSIVDSGNEVLVLVGIKRSEHRPDRVHPFGYGMELYFWTMIVAIMIFALGGGLSIYEGIDHVASVQPGDVPGDPFWSYIVILGAMVIEGLSLRVAVKQFNKERGDIKPLAFIKSAKDPSLYTVVLEDTAAELGLFVALIGTLLTQLTGNLYFDGGASIVIGLLLAAVAILLLRETKGLLIGEGMSRNDIMAVEKIIESNLHVIECGRVLSMYLGPHDLLLNIDVTFDRNITRDQTLDAVDDIEAAIVSAYPDVTRVFIEPESLRFTRENGPSSQSE